MPRSPFYQTRDTTELADSLAFDEKASNDIWSLGFGHAADRAIAGLGNLLKPPDPLPVIVSDRPEAKPITTPEQMQQTWQSGNGGASTTIAPEQQPEPTTPSAPAPASMASTSTPAPPSTATSVPSAMPSASAAIPSSQPTGPAPERGGDLRAYARSVALRNGLDPDIFERQINQESGFQNFRPDGTVLRSGAGAAGIGQFMPGTAAAYGVDVNDPYSGLEGAARHMADNLKRNGGDYRLALAAYNAGQGNVDRYGEGVFGADFANGQTRDYVNIILGPGGQPRTSQGAPTSTPSAASTTSSTTSPSQPGTTPSQTPPQEILILDNGLKQGPAGQMRVTRAQWEQMDQRFWTVVGTEQGTLPVASAPQAAPATTTATGPSTSASMPSMAAASPGPSTSAASDLMFRQPLNQQTPGDAFPTEDASTSPGASVPSQAPPQEQQPTPAAPGAGAFQDTDPGWYAPQYASVDESGRKLPAGSEGIASPGGSAPAGTLAPQQIPNEDQTAYPLPDYRTPASPLVEAPPTDTANPAASIETRLAAQQPPERPSGVVSSVPGAPDLTPRPGEFATVDPEQQQIMAILQRIATYGETGKVVANQAISAIKTGTFDPRSVLNLLNIVPYDLYTRARQELFSDPEAIRSSGTDPLSPVRAVEQNLTGRDVLPSAAELNPEGRPASDVIGGTFAANFLPGQEFADPLTSAGLHVAPQAAIRAPGLARAGLRAGLRGAADVIDRGIERAAPVVRDIGANLRENAGRVAALNAERAGTAAAPAYGTLGAVPVAEAPHTYSPTAPEGYNRMYHGTASDFPSVDPERLDPNGLYGPGYYTTSDPRVAGSYADMTAGSRKFSISDRVSNLQNQITDLRRMNADGLEPSPLIGGPSTAVQLQRAEDELARLTAAGPNVRPLDVPAGLNLLDADAPLTPDVISRVQSVVSKATPEVRQELSVTLDGAARMLQEGQQPTVDALLTGMLGDAERVTRQINGQADRGLFTEIMQRAGFDGIQHTGGQRVPMMDSAGLPIEHNVNVIFPGAVGKVRNAFSGTYGGATVGPVSPGRSSGLLDAANRQIGSAIVGGTTGAAVGAGTDQEDPARGAQRGALIGAGLAVAGHNAMRVAGRRGEGALATLGAVPPEGARPPRTGNLTQAFGDKPGERVQFRFRVVPMEDLVTSHTNALGINRDFPSELQPRVRERAASRAQIERIMKEFDPEQMLVDTHTVDRGPMIVGPDNVVESGNGRSIALRRLAEEHPQEYQRYVDELRGSLGDYGLADADLRGIRNPVLVRERLTDLNRTEFAASANVSAAAEMAPIERAFQDASRLSDEHVANLTVGEGQSIDQALLSPSNIETVRAFVSAVPDAERGALLDAQGNLNAYGLERLKSALLARTYTGEAGTRISTAFVESTDPGVRNVENAVYSSLPAVARSEAMIAAGERDASLSIAPDVAVAVDVYARLRRAGMSVPDYLAQAPLFGERETNAVQDQILQYLNDNARSPRRIRDMLEGYANAVDNQADAAQVGMFGEASRATKEEVLNGVTRELGAAPADASADLGRVGAGGQELEGPGAGSSAASESSAGAQALPAADESLARFQRAQAGPEATPVAPRTPASEIIPRGGPEGQLAQEGAPEPRARTEPLQGDVIPPTGGQEGSLAQQGAPRPVVPQGTPGVTPPNPQQTLEAARQWVNNQRANPQARRLAAGIQRGARRGAPPTMPDQLPGFPAPPPKAPPTFNDAIQAWRYSMGLFGSISTGLLQAAGGAAEVALGAPTEIIRQALLRGHPEHVPLIIGEALKSVPAGVRSFGSTAAGKIPSTIQAGSDYRPPLSDKLTGAGRVAALAVETPGRVATQAPDAFWYEIYYRTGLAQAAAEEAQKTTGRLNPAASWQAQQQLIKSPTPEMVTRAHEFAQDSTYKGELGTVGKAIGTIFRGPENPTSGLGRAWREVGSYIMPVYHTIARIHEGSLNYTPGIGLLPLDRLGLAARGRSTDTKIAQQIVGLGLTAGILGYAAEGGIRGPGPSDPDKLKEMIDQGYTPNSTNIGGIWVRNQDLGKAGPIINMVGAYNDAVTYGNGKEAFNEQRWDQKTKALVDGFARALSDYPAAQAFSTILKARTDPVGALAELGSGAASQFVPAAYRTYVGANDPNARTVDRGPDVTPEQHFMDTFAQRSGVGREDLPISQNRLGENQPNVRQGWNVLLPRVGQDRPNTVIQTFLDNGIDLGRPPQTVSYTPKGGRGKGVETAPVSLTPAEQRVWNTYRGETVKDELRRTVQSSFWQRASREDKQDELKAILAAANKTASERVIDDMGKDFDRRLDESIGEQRTQRGIPVGR